MNAGHLRSSGFEYGTVAIGTRVSVGSVAVLCCVVLWGWVGVLVW